MASDQTFSRRGRRSGFNSIPHEFWELRFGDNDRTSMSALILLGWLHSHQSEYLARLSQRMISERLGWSRPRIAAALDTLAGDGWVELTTVANRSCVMVNDDRFADWLEDAIAARRNGNDSIPTRKSDGNDIEPKVATISSQQLALNGNDSMPSTIENTISEKTRAETPMAASFDSFWALYPKKVSKPDAQKSWNRATKARKVKTTAIVDGLRPWLVYWERRNEPEFIPNPATWLNGDRFNDSPPPIMPKAAVGRPSAMRIDDGTEPDNMEAWR